MKTLFFDRDGVINYNAPQNGYVREWKDFIFIPGARGAIRKLTQAGYRIIVLTNQAGIARGLLTEQQLTDIHDTMVNEIVSTGGKIQAVYYCPHAPDADCHCRKPKPGMLIRAARQHDVEISSTYFIGDSLTDIAAGNAVGAHTILVLTGHGRHSYLRYLDSVKGRNTGTQRTQQGVATPDKLFTGLDAAAAWLSGLKLRKPTEPKRNTLARGQNDF